MKQSMKIIWVLAVAAVVAASVGGVNYLLNNGVAHGTSGNSTLTKVYNVDVREANGTVEPFNLSQVGGYAYVSASQNGTWHLNGTLSRIVTFIPSVTATLYALHTYGNVVGVDQYSTYPVPPKNVAVITIQVGDIPVETITNLTPDVIITTIGGFSTQQIDQVVNVLHIPYLVLDPGSIPQIETQNTVLGYLTGASHNASLINGWMNANLQNLSKDLSNVSAASEKTAFYYLGPYEGGVETAGNGTFINNELTAAHLINIVNISGYPDVSSSYVINATPDYVLLDQYYNESSLNATIPGLAAEKDSHVVAVANDSFFTEPNFRIIYSIYWLAEHFYPGNVNLTDVIGFSSYTHLNLSQNPETGVNS